METCSRATQSCSGREVTNSIERNDEIVGVSKDLGGIVVVRVPSELIEKSNSDPSSPEAQEYADLQKDAAAIQAGDSSYIVLTSDTYEDSNKYIYDFELKGIDGSGKSYNTSDVIDQKRKSIYNCFGAGFLLLGQDSVGSYALSSSAKSTHEHYVQKIVNDHVDVINNQLAPRLLAVNNVYLDFKDMPEFEPANPNELDLETLGKFIQRVKSVGGLTKSAIEHLYEKAGLPTDGMDDLVFDTGDTSRAGESQGSSGTGNTQSGGASSAVNSENGGTTKSLLKSSDLFVSKVTDEEIFVTNSKNGETISILRNE